MLPRCNILIVALCWSSCQNTNIRDELNNPPPEILVQMNQLMTLGLKPVDALHIWRECLAFVWWRIEVILNLC
jgi:hypothetical protein